LGDEEGRKGVEPDVGDGDGGGDDKQEGGYKGKKGGETGAGCLESVVGRLDGFKERMYPSERFSKCDRSADTRPSLVSGR